MFPRQLSWRKNAIDCLPGESAILPLRPLIRNPVRLRLRERLATSWTRPTQESEVQGIAFPRQPHGGASTSGGSDDPTRHLIEAHYSPRQVAEMRGISDATVSRLFEDEPRRFANLDAAVATEQPEA